MKNIFGVLLLFWMMAACSTSKETTVVVNSAPISTSENIGTDTSSLDEIKKVDFRELKVGEPFKLYGLDPLYASNDTELRAINLVYEGLVSYNSSGEIIPALATKWEISEDSLVYTFTLANRFFQDSEVFSTGVGRKVQPQDVISSFTRAAMSDKPTFAQEGFEAVKGFLSFVNEQAIIRQGYLRRLDKISGFSVIDKQTIQIELSHKDTGFIDFLATPYAVVYPFELANDDYITFDRAVGTGPYKFTAKREEGDRVIFAKSADYDGAEIPAYAVDRIDFIVRESYNELYEMYRNDELDIIHAVYPALVPSNLEGEFLSIETDEYVYDLKMSKQLYSEIDKNQMILSLNKIDWTDALSSFYGKYASLIKWASSMDATENIGQTKEPTVYRFAQFYPALYPFQSMFKEKFASQNIEIDYSDILVGDAETQWYWYPHFYAKDEFEIETVGRIYLPVVHLKKNLVQGNAWDGHLGVFRAWELKIPLQNN